MSSPDITTRINDLLGEMGYTEVKPTEYGLNLKTLLSMDSLDFVEMIMRVEVEFTITIPDPAIADIDTFEQLVQAIDDASKPIIGYPSQLLKK
jgi:acyl carrier protein